MTCHPSSSRRCRLLVLLLLIPLAATPALSWADDPPAQPEIVPAPQNLENLRAIEAKVREVVAKALPCTVGIRVGKSSGSGILVSEDGLVMTAGHVAVNPGEQAVFVTHDGKEYKGVSLGVYRTADAGLMKINDERKWPFVPLGKIEDVKLGEWCVAMGHPLGYVPGRPPVVRIGRVLVLQERVVQTDCPLISGDSGGPLLDLEGRVIGVNSRIGGPINMNFHVAINVFHENWERLKKGDGWEDAMPGRTVAEVNAAFRSVVSAASQCVARIRCDGNDAALGTIVGPDGWVLTKASELKGRIVCRLRDGRDLDAQLVGVNPQFDLAMLKVDAAHLPVIPWSLKDPDVGQWVAAPGLEDNPLAVGVVSVPRRAIPPVGGSLGVQIRDSDKGILIDEIVPNSPADKAGMKKGDIITHFNGKEAKSHLELAAEIKKHKLGAKVTLTVTRDDKKLDFSATLGQLVTPATKQRDMLNATGVGVSRRHDDFPIVLQHDTILRPVDCGCPLVGLDGKVVGVNIARGGRTETYCIPTNALVLLMYDLMSGRLRPQPAPTPAQPEKDAKPQAEPAPEAPKEPEKQPEAPKDAKPQAEPAPAPETPKEPEKKPEAEPKPEAPPEAPKEPEKQPEAPKEPEKKPEAEPKPEAPPEAPKEPEKQPESPPEAPQEPDEPEAEPAPEVEPQPEPHQEPLKKAE